MCIIFQVSLPNKIEESKKFTLCLFPLLLVLLSSLHVNISQDMVLLPLWLHTLLTTEISLPHNFKAFIPNPNLSKDPVKHLQVDLWFCNILWVDCSVQQKHFIWQLSTYTHISTNKSHEVILSFHFFPIWFHLKNIFHLISRPTNRS